MKLSVVLTDLDGTLLEPDGRLGREAAEAVARLRALGIPVVPLTSKTERELLEWLEILDAGRFGSFENGAGVVAPEGTEIHPRALPVERLRQVLERAAKGAGAEVRAIDEIPLHELAELTGLGGQDLEAALQRAYDLPFLPPVRGREGMRGALAGLEGVRLTEGGVFWHLTGAHDKGDCAQRIREKLARSGLVVGLGDAPNDASFLSMADLPVLVPGRKGLSPALRKAFPEARIAPGPCGEGWAAAVHAILEEAPDSGAPEAA